MKYSSNAILAKCRAMFSRFLSDKDYKNLASCATVNEAASFLKSHTDYGQAMSAVSGSMTVDKIENLLYRRLLQRFERISKYELSVGDEFYRYFLIQNDVKWIIGQMRRIRSHAQENETVDIPAFFASHAGIDIDALFRTESFEEIITLLEKTPYADILKPFKQDDDALAAETALLKYANESVRTYTGKNKTIMSLIAAQSDMRNLVTIYRCIGFGCDAARMERYIYTKYTNLTDKQWKMMLEAKNGDALIELIKKTPYGKDFEYDGYFEGAVDTMLYKRFHKGIRFYTDPAAVLICFVFLAENEVKNIIHVIEGVKYKISAEDISKVLVGVNI